MRRQPNYLLEVERLEERLRQAEAHVATLTAERDALAGALGTALAMKSIAERRPGRTKLMYDKTRRTIVAVAEALNITADDADMGASLAASHPTLQRGQVWCRRCGRTLHVDSAECLRSGWPTCHGATMTLDQPDWQIENDEKLRQDFGGRRRRA